jgi:hypothetical protein
MSDEPNEGAGTPAPPLYRQTSRSGKPRATAVPLEWPFSYDGVVYEEIPLRRVSVAEIAAWVEGLADNPDAPLPVFGVPSAVLDMLDPDDDDRLSEVARDFLPRRFQDAAGPPPEAGDDTPPSSPPSSDRESKT